MIRGLIVVIGISACCAWAQLPGQAAAAAAAAQQQQQQQQQQQPAQQQPAPATPAPSPITAIPTQTEAQRPPANGSAPANMVLNLPNASLLEVIDLLAKQLKINYILDPRVKGGGVTIHTYGEIKGVDVRSLLETILRVNGAAMIQVGDLYRIVPTAEVGRLPLSVTVDPKDLPEDERMTLNLIFLKYVMVGEIQKLVEPFLGEGNRVSTYEPANLLIIQDNARNMRRTMDLIAMFDSDKFASQRVRLFEMRNGRPSDIAKEVESVLKGIGMGEKTSVKFLPLDRINTLIAVAPNTGVFVEVEKWIEKFDIPVKAPVGAVDNYVYRVKYGRAEILSQAVMALYTGNPYMLMMLSSMGMGMSGRMGGGFGGGMGGMGMMGGGYGGGVGAIGATPYGMAGGYNGYGMGGMGYGGMGMMGMGMMGMGMMPMMGGYGMPYGNPMSSGSRANAAAAAGTQGTGAGTATDQTGSYLQGSGFGFGGGGQTPRVVPNPFDNTLLIQSTPQEYEQVVKLLRQLDIAPRQVLIEAKIYEVTLTGEFSSGVQAFLQRRTAASGNPTTALNPSRQLLFNQANGLALTAGLLAGQTRELLVFLNANENRTRVRTVSSPTVIATDNIPASISVGVDVPVLTSQGVSPFQQGGTSVPVNQIQNRSAGVSFSIQAQVLPSGVVTLFINQGVSNPQQPAQGAAIQSPSFSKRDVSTQVTVLDGDTVAVGGIIQETESNSTGGIPGLVRIPVVGGLFGSKQISKGRTELIVFFTPRVIYDTTDVVDAAEEIKAKVKLLKRSIRE